MSKKNFRKITVAVTALNAIDSPGPGVAVIRSLKEIKDYKLRIIGLSYESLEPGIYMDELVDKTYQIPYPSAGIEALITRLKYINEIENIDLIIPNFDAELYNFIKVSDKLKDMGIKTFLPSLEDLEARDKLNLFSFGKKHHLPVPRDVQIFKPDKIKEAIEELGLPVVIKGKYYEAAIATTLEQAHKEYYKISAKWGLPIIAQEFIQGQELNVAALGDGLGNSISIIPMKKMYITDKGKAWAGITIENKPLIAMAKKIIKSTKWKGGMELEIMQTNDEKHYIMEINPRFPAWIFLSAAVGQNQPEALMRMALNEKVVPFKKYEIGKMFIRYAWDMIVDLEKFQIVSAHGEL
jgi:carbamoyl-phosphate synthase large subunit